MNAERPGGPRGEDRGRLACKSVMAVVRLGRARSGSGMAAVRSGVSGSGRGLAGSGGEGRGHGGGAPRRGGAESQRWRAGTDATHTMTHCNRR